MRQSTIELMQKHHRLISDMARKMSRRYNYPDMDDLIAEGRAIVLSRMGKWNPARGAFTTYATWVLRNGLLDYIKRQKRMVQSEQIDECLPDYRKMDSLPGRLDDLMGSLSDAGREVLDVCLTSDFGDVFKNSRDHRQAEGLIEWEMKTRGHSDATIRQGIAEVRSQITEGW